MLAVRNFEYSSLIVIAAGGVGAYVGALIGAMVAIGRVRKRRIRRNGGVSVVEEHPPVRAAGVLLAVTVSSDKETEVARLLRESGGQDVERANGRWENGKWQDFDPLVPPEPEPAAR
jgi:hypothetical protein